MYCNTYDICTYFILGWGMFSSSSSVSAYSVSLPFRCPFSSPPRTEIVAKKKRRNSEYNFSLSLTKFPCGNYVHTHTHNCYITIVLIYALTEHCLNVYLKITLEIIQQNYRMCCKCFFFVNPRTATARQKKNERMKERIQPKG